MSKSPRGFHAGMAVVTLVALGAFAAGALVGNKVPASSEAPTTAIQAPVAALATQPEAPVTGESTAGTAVALNITMEPPITEHTWELSDIVVKNPGQIIEVADGTMLRNYLLSGQAHAADGSLIKDANLQIALSAFKPNRDLPGQPAGHWYVNGSWTLVDVNAPTPVRRQRNRESAIRGLLMAQMHTDLTTLEEGFTLNLHLPMGPVLGRWSRGTGTANLDLRNQNGNISLVLRQ